MARPSPLVVAEAFIAAVRNIPPSLVKLTGSTAVSWWTQCQSPRQSSLLWPWGWRFWKHWGDLCPAQPRTEDEVPGLGGRWRRTWRNGNAGGCLSPKSSPRPRAIFLLLLPADISFLAWMERMQGFSSATQCWSGGAWSEQFPTPAERVPSLLSWSNCCLQ